MKRLIIIALLIAQCFNTKHAISQQTRGLDLVGDVDTIPRGMHIQESNLRVVSGKIYNEVNGMKSPAAYKRIVLMPMTMTNLSRAENSMIVFDDSMVNNIPGAKITTTTRDGNYEFNNILSGAYIIRVVGRGGSVIQFSIPMEYYIRKRIPDALAFN